MGIGVGEVVSSIGDGLGRMVFGGRGLVPQSRWTGRCEGICVLEGKFRCSICDDPMPFLR